MFLLYELEFNLRHDSKSRQRGSSTSSSCRRVGFFFNTSPSLVQTSTSVCLIVSSDFITTLLPGKPKKLWIGLKDNQWVDNTPVKYHNFNPLIHGQLRLMYINASVPLFPMFDTIPVTFTFKKKKINKFPTFSVEKDSYVHSSVFCLVV